MKFTLDIPDNKMDGVNFVCNKHNEGWTAQQKLDKTGNLVFDGAGKPVYNDAKTVEEYLTFAFINAVDSYNREKLIADADKEWDAKVASIS